MTGHPRYPYFGIPPSRQPRPAADEPALKGKRVILSTPEGFVYDMRAATEIYCDGKPVIDIVAEGHGFAGCTPTNDPRLSLTPSISSGSSRDRSEDRSD